jgi:hypothetical protein
VLLGTDNLGNVFAINSAHATGVGRRSASGRIREMYQLARLHNFEFSAVWVPRELNTTADAMSKALTYDSAMSAALASTPCSVALHEVRRHH